MSNDFANIEDQKDLKQEIENTKEKIEKFKNEGNSNMVKLETIHLELLQESLNQESKN